MDAWYYICMWDFGIWIHSPLTSVGVVHSTWPSRTMWHMHAPTFNKWQQKKKKTLHMSTHGALRRCGLTSLVVCINDKKIYDIRERNVTIRSESWTTNIRPLGFRDIREWVILWRLILRSLGCNDCVKLLEAVCIYICSTLRTSFETLCSDRGDFWV